MMEYISNFYQEYEFLFIWLGVLSVITFIASIVLVPLFIKTIPKDYFVNDSYHRIKLRTPFDIMKFILKNTLGVVLVLAGIIMLFTPGQGILSIVIGLFLMQFKGKYALEQKLIANDTTFNALNWIREKVEKPPFLRNS